MSVVQILVIDDDAALHSLVSPGLEMQGYTVMCTSTHPAMFARLWR